MITATIGANAFLRLFIGSIKCTSNKSQQGDLQRAKTFNRMKNIIVYAKMLYLFSAGLISSTRIYFTSQESIIAISAVSYNS